MKKNTLAAIVAGFVLAFCAPAALADSLTVQQGNGIHSYEGIVLGVDQVRAAGAVTFRATAPEAFASNLRKAQRAAFNTGAWSVRIDDADALPVYSAIGCAFEALAYLDEAGMHIYLDCSGAKEVARGR